MAGFVVATAVGLGDEGVESEKKADAEDGGCVVDRVAEGDGSNGGWTERADHDGIDDGLEHPTDFTEDDRESERNHGAQFPSPIELDGVRHNSNVTLAMPRYLNVILK